jgi:hypothetical protein
MVFISDVANNSSFQTHLDHRFLILVPQEGVEFFTLIYHCITLQGRHSNTIQYVCSRILHCLTLLAQSCTCPIRLGELHNLDYATACEYPSSDG